MEITNIANAKHEKTLKCVDNVDRMCVNLSTRVCVCVFVSDCRKRILSDFDFHVCVSCPSQELNYAMTCEIQTVFKTWKSEQKYTCHLTVLPWENFIVKPNFKLHFCLTCYLNIFPEKLRKFRKHMQRNLLELSLKLYIDHINNTNWHENSNSCARVQQNTFS